VRAECDKLKMTTNCPALDITALLGEHTVGSTIPTFLGGVGPCQDGDVLEGQRATSCAVECKNGWATHEFPRNIPFEVYCWKGAGDTQPAVHMDSFRSRDSVKAAPLECKPNACISTPYQATADNFPTTHILCENGLIASGTTGNCQCTAEDPTTQTTQAAETTQTTTSSAVSLRSEYAQMLLFSLSFLV
jgi:hypothetical protein